MRKGLMIVPASLIIMGLSLSGSRPAVAENEDAVTTLDKRLDAIEKVVVKDNIHPSSTHAARLERIEKMLQINAKDAEVDQKTDAKTFDELKASLIKTQREMEGLEKRLIQMENNKLDRKSADLSKELEKLDRLIQLHTTTLREMETRVKKLETVVRP